MCLIVCCCFFLINNQEISTIHLPRHISRKKQLKSEVKDTTKHRLDVQNIKNSPNGFNSMLRAYNMQKFAAKTRVKILNSKKRIFSCAKSTCTY